MTAVTITFLRTPRLLQTNNITIDENFMKVSRITKSQQPDKLLLLQSST